MKYHKVTIYFIFYMALGFIYKKYILYNIKKLLYIRYKPTDTQLYSTPSEVEVYGITINRYMDYDYGFRFDYRVCE